MGYVYNVVKKSQKPAIIVDYNKTKFIVDKFDQMTKHSSFSPTTRRWSQRVLFWLVDVAMQNAWVLYRNQQKIEKANAGDRRSFLHRLGQQLMQPQKDKRRVNAVFPTTDFQKIEVAGQQIHNKQAGKAQMSVYWCYIGSHSVRSEQAINTCENCNRNVCQNHMVQRMLDPKFSHLLWSVYERTLKGSHRTNNYAEAANHRIQCELDVCHPGIWGFIDLLRIVQQGRDKLFIDWQSGKQAKENGSSTKADASILNIVESYAERNTQEYLKGLANNYEMDD